MIAATQQEQKKAKISFFAVYIASIVLILVIAVSLFKGTPTALTSTPVIYSAGAVTKADDLLHAKAEVLDSMYARSLAGNGTGVIDTIGLSLAKREFQATTDSIAKAAETLQDATEKAEIAALVARFKKAVQVRGDMINMYAVLLHDSAHTITSVQNTTTNNQELEQLKTILLQKEQRITVLEGQQTVSADDKDKQIAALQKQLRERPVTSMQTSDDGEWKQKYASLMTVYNKVVGQNTTLNKSYQTLVDDNRRLLAQLQSARNN